jgi:metallo-beta-lactamase family protein
MRISMSAMARASLAARGARVDRDQTARASARQDVLVSTLSFHGANGTVTGSRYLFEEGGRRMLVDCGLFQGYKQLRLRNWASPPFDPATLDAVVLTHAHIDHSGWLPRLVRLGFRGPVFATAATAELCAILLPDAARIQEEDARWANETGYSRHRPALPLYTEDDARACLAQFRVQTVGHAFAPMSGTTVRLQRAGHLLGAASVRIAHETGELLLSGDIGRPHDPVMLPPEPVGAADIVVVESTYGDRRHPDVEPADELADVFARVAARGGTAIVPTFAVGRAQALLLAIARLKAARRIPDVPVFLDSPMAVDATALYLRHRAEHRLDAEACARMRDAAVLVRDVAASRALQRRRGPMIVLAASGMVTGGRVLHHLAARAGDARNAIVLTGHQAGGTRGAALAAHAPSVRIHGRDVDVRAEVAQVGALSAHADADELLAWLATAARAPRTVAVTHGEPDAAEALRRRIAHELRWTAFVPRDGETLAL